jgi:hypothetical protein
MPGSVSFSVWYEIRQFLPKTIMPLIWNSDNQTWAGCQTATLMAMKN